MNITWILAAVTCLLFLEPCLAKLKLIQTVFRHGNRTPTNWRWLYPKDPYINMTYEPEGLGGLTNTGKMAAYKLGQYFRARYDELLGPIYSNEAIWFCADQVDRVVMTGELVAAGLYPPRGEQKWNPDLNWQPIPIWQPSNDYLYDGMFCKNSREWRTQVLEKDKNVVKFVEGNAEIYEYLSRHTGSNFTQQGAFSFRQNLYAQRDLGLKLPAWVKPIFPNGKLDELAAYDILIRTGTPELKQLLGGVWLREWLNHVDNYLRKKSPQKAFMYAAHDLTLAYMLVALDNYDNKIPAYCSAIMLELHEEDDGHFVQIFYRNEDNVRILNIPGCGCKMCPLETFKNFVMPVIPKDPVALCGNTD